MPVKKTYTKKTGAKGTGKKKYYRKKNSLSVYSTLGRGHSTFPPTLKTKFFYSDLLELNIVSSGIGQLTYALNSLWDPYRGVGGHQPRGFDTLVGNKGGSAPYYNYRVHECFVKAIFVNDNSSTTGAGIFFMHARDTGDDQIASFQDCFEQPNTICKDVNSGYSPRGTTSLQKLYKLGTLMSVKDIKDNEDASAVYNNDPASLWVFDIGYVPYQNAIDTTVFVRLEITYYAELYNQNYLVQS